MMQLSILLRAFCFSLSILLSNGARSRRASVESVGEERQEMMDGRRVRRERRRL
jgi:hypothetical protein